MANISNFVFSILGEFAGLLISVILIFIFGFERSHLSLYSILGVASIITVVTTYSYFQQRLYRKEKIADLLPYENLNSIFAIIAGFLLFRDSSVISLIISILAFFVIVVFSIDFKTLTIPKSMKWILIVQLFITAETILTGRLLKNVPDVEYYIIYEVLVIIMLLFPIIRKKQYKDLKGLKPKFYGFRIGGSIAGNLSYLLYLFMVGNFGIVLSILFSFIGTGITLLFGYVILKEKPSKKDIWMAVIVSALVGIGFIFQ